MKKEERSKQGQTNNKAKQHMYIIGDYRIENLRIYAYIMKGTKVQTLGARAVSGACMAGWLIGFIIIMTVVAIIRMRTAN